jgi:outer membrane protein assembly factor BamB
MPAVAVGDVADIAMSPSGKLLAVAGSSGVQVFHFNGSSPITHYTAVLTKDAVAQVDQLFWDNANHLYAISQAAGKLFVFTVTATSYSQAAGSPYTITNPGSIVVLGK